ncbi:hypothetical protein [Aquabacterium sp. OR-4]|uniref:hypothetical protein n=1 Tax=Aquabacterium sp. OR-4 TaxID=2978127 RepID=UPI0028C9E559|nr:hypothetical protein [Aquabacterium sp. OR-4]MDT7836550.1 hypothetical protein [Aquabacterium sp. OR-4]
MQHRLANDTFGFVRGLTLRTPGVAIQDVRIGVARVHDPLDWDTPACRLQISGDTAQVLFDRPDNWARFGFDILAAAAGDGASGQAATAAPLGRLEMLAPEPEAAVRERLRGSRIAFLGTARDCARALPASIQRLRELGSLFGAHEIHVYENDSQDATGTLLEQMAGDRLLQLQREQGIAARMPRRTERLAYGRNRLLDAVLARGPWDYIAWADLDGLVGPRFSTEGFLSNFQYEPVWDAVFPLSWPLYYDTWALREDHFCRDDYVWDGQHRLNAALFDGRDIHAATQILAPQRVKGWVPVRSAFGGFGLYKGAIASRGRYAGLVHGREVCEHVPYHAALQAAGARLYLNPQCLTHIA